MLDVVSNVFFLSFCMKNVYKKNFTSYTCGSARQFKSSSDSLYDQHSITCQWDKTWTGSTQLDECVWIACLKPPTPPPDKNLVNTDWDGRPIEFDGHAHFVCKRGYK